MNITEMNTEVAIAVSAEGRDLTNLSVTKYIGKTQNGKKIRFWKLPSGSSHNDYFPPNI